MNQSLTIDFDKRSDKQKLFDALKKVSGIARVDIKPFSKSNSRYKYYFGYVLTEILQTGFYMFPDANNQLSRAVNTAQIHEIMKFRYNPIITVDPFSGEQIKLGGGSTTTMSDTEFINRFQETILSDHAGDPFYIEFLDYDSWRIILKGKSKLELS